MLAETTPILLKLSSGKDLTTEETRRAFNIIGDEDTEGYFFTALTMGLMAKGPTIEEMYGFCLDRKDRVGTLRVGINPANIIDISGGGGDKIKTINVSTAASFVLAAGGISVAKQAAKAFTGFTGSSDVLEALGIKIPTDKVDTQRLIESLREFGITAYNYAALAPDRFINFFHWRQKVIAIGLKYLIPWHIAAFAYSAIPMENRIYGLANPKYAILLAKLLQRVGHKRIMVVHGVDGLDEVSNIGETRIVEIRGNRQKEYKITPQDLGVKTANVRDLTTNSSQENIIDFVRVLYGKEVGPKRDLVAINAGLGFYLIGKTKTLKRATRLAIDIIASGRAFRKLEDLVRFNEREKQLEEWLARAIS